MKYTLLLAFLPAAVAAQRLHIAVPTTNQTLAVGQNFTAELHMDDYISTIAQKSVVVVVTACLDVCAQSDQWGPSVVLYNGPFDPQFNVSASWKGLYQYFSLLLSYPESFNLD
ncbi:hypothetical protein PsYK624_145880 [Phanerochaete sordida]|uniref:Uncharacterized protein n=1 Tax=Phanerochaete sordida TaxID=48140 RepID=A0A9P3GS28_9APHY|nr:hypothetical protein PsYK624_145880 [Phanerochaete sordida]